MTPFRLNALDGKPDVADCGGGEDTAIVDAATRCEAASVPTAEDAPLGRLKLRPARAITAVQSPSARRRGVLGVDHGKPRPALSRPAGGISCRWVVAFVTFLLHRALRAQKAHQARVGSRRAEKPRFC